MKKVLEYFKSFKELDVISLCISIIITIILAKNENWKQTIPNNIENIVFLIILFIIIFNIFKAIFYYSENHLIFRGFIIGFVVCLILVLWQNNTVFNIGEDAEKIVVTMDNNYNSDKYDLYMQDYIKGDNNSFDIEQFIEDIEDSIYENEDKYEEYYDARINEKYYKKTEN